MTEFGKFIITFIAIDLLQLLCWLFSIGHLTVWKNGPIDAQSGFFFFCLISFYILVSCSLLLLVIFIIKYYKSISSILIGLILNLHAVIITIWYLKSVLAI